MSGQGDIHPREGKHIIRKDEMIPMLLAACPAFRPQWEEHVAYWEGEEAGIYNDLSKFVRYLISVYESGQTSVLEAAFGLLERFFLNGDAEVQDCAALGIIETLQNAASHQPYKDRVFVPFLKEHSLREWKAIEQGWEDLMNRKRPV